MGQSTSNKGRRNDRGNALPKDDPPDVTRFRSAAAKRLQAHRARARMGLRTTLPPLGAVEAARVTVAIEAWRPS